MIISSISSIAGICRKRVGTECTLKFTEIEVNVCLWDLLYPSALWFQLQILCLLSKNCLSLVLSIQIWSSVSKLNLFVVSFVMFKRLITSNQDLSVSDISIFLHWMEEYCLYTSILHSMQCHSIHILFRLCKDVSVEKKLSTSSNWSTPLAAYFVHLSSVNACISLYFSFLKYIDLFLIIFQIGDGLVEIFRSWEKIWLHWLS